MKNKSAILVFGKFSLFVSLLFIAAGCEIDSTSSDVNVVQATPTPAPTRTTNNNPQPTTTTEPSPAASPKPTPTPTAAPATSSGGFLWQPSGDSVKVVIPADMPHWQMHVFSRRKHATLYGPDNRGGNREENIVYTLPGSGESWSRKSSNAGDDGTLLVFINSRDAETGPYKSAGWRIMNPAGTVSGNGSRIQPGEDK